MMRETQDHSHSVARSAFRFSLGTMLSRVSGMGREIAMAFCFGTSPLIAAFLIAFRLAHLLRRLFGEGALLVGFIPHFESIRGKSEQEASLFFRDVYFALGCVLIAVIALLECLLFGIIRSGALAADNVQLLELTMWILPGLLFICLSALSSALLQCEKRFFLPGISPVVFNCTWIAAIFFVQSIASSEAVVGLAIGTVVAFAFQWLLLLPSTTGFLRRFLTLKELLSIRLFSPEIRQMLHSISLGVIGLGAVQINGFLDTLFARAASLEGPAYLNYALRLHQLPMALIGVSLASALLPPLSRALKGDQLEKFNQLLSFGLMRSLTLSLPFTLAILALGAAATNAIFHHGHFTGESAYHTTLCLWSYGLGLIPMIFTLIVSQGFYALKDFRTPMFASLLAVGVNLICNALLVFVFELGAASIALATSFSSVCSFVFLYRRLVKKTGAPLLLESKENFWKTACASSIASGGALAIGALLFNDPTLSVLMQRPDAYFARGLTEQLLHIITIGGSFIALFLLSAYLLQAKEILALITSKKLLENEPT